MKRKYRPVQIGDIYGELTVIEEDFEREQKDIDRNPKGWHLKYYKCLCSCGEIVTVQMYQLLKGRTRSCGHLRRQHPKQPKDLTGFEVNYLKVLYQDTSKPKGSGKHAYWICKCKKCGNEKSIRSSELILGQAIDCGCEKWKRNSNGSAIDLTGQKFGHLIVLERDWKQFKKGGGRAAYWLCKCDLCGRIESNSSDMLLNYGKDRCRGCSGMSLGEQKIREILDEHNIPYIQDKPYADLRYLDTGGTPRFDFRITQKSECDYIIEFDGLQHFREVTVFPNDDGYEKRKQRDSFKNEWCKSNNIPIIRIPYTRLKKLCYEDLNPNTTKYLV